MRALVILATAMLLGWAQPAASACINNHTDDAVYVDQYSLFSEEDVFKIEPGQKLCRGHETLFNRYNIALVPYDSVDNLCRFYLSRDSDEVFIDGHCDHKDGKKCVPQVRCGRGNGLVDIQHAAKP